MGVDKDPTLFILKTSGARSDFRDLAVIVASHPLPNEENEENAKGPLPSTPIVDVSYKHQQLKMCMRILGSNGVRSGHKSYTGSG